jgi:hypothetical protein
MYKHVVFWKLKDDVNGMSKKELTVEVKKRLDEFWKYTKYPIHDKVVDFIKSVQLDEYIVDYELD